MIKINKKCIFAIVFAFLFALFSGGNLPYSIFYIVVLSIFFEIFYLRMVINHVSIRLNIINKKFYTGQHETLNIIINSYCAPYMYIINESIKKINNEYNGNVFFIDMDANKLLKTDVKFDYRGVYDLGTFKVKIEDLFGMFSLSRNIYLKSKKINVYPRIYYIEEKDARGNSLNQSKLDNILFRDDMSAVKDVRKYVSGDSVKRIHWKLSAKNSELYIKRFESTFGTECNIFLDMNSESYFIDNKEYAEEKLIEYCASLINYMKNNRISSSLFINNKVQNKFRVYNNSTFDNFMENIINVKSDGYVAFEDFIFLNYGHISRGSSIMIITVSITEKIIHRVIMLKEKGFNIKLIYYANCPIQYKNVLGNLKIKIEKLKIYNT